MPTQRSSLLTKSAEGATFLIVLQLISRALTFLVNQLLLRYLSPELLGISTQLEAYSLSVLFFAREPLRVVILRQTSRPENEIEIQQEKHEPGRTRAQVRTRVDARKTQVIVNLAYLSLCLGIFFAFALAWVYLRSLRSTPSILGTPYFPKALRLYGIATLLELLAEPCFVVVQQKSEYRIRAAAESIATVLRCLVTCGSAVLAYHKGLDIGVLPFALGQWIYGLSLLFVYFRRVRRIASAGGFSLTARPIPSRYHRATPESITRAHLSTAVTNTSYYLTSHQHFSPWGRVYFCREL
jgi:oligosaccharide translocation protein RFT1